LKSPDRKMSEEVSWSNSCDSPQRDYHKYTLSGCSSNHARTNGFSSDSVNDTPQQVGFRFQGGGAVRSTAL
jgi:hypothetical protein